MSENTPQNKPGFDPNYPDYYAKLQSGEIPDCPYVSKWGRPRSIVPGGFVLWNLSDKVQRNLSRASNWVQEGINRKTENAGFAERFIMGFVKNALVIPLSLISAIVGVFAFAITVPLPVALFIPAVVFNSIVDWNKKRNDDRKQEQEIAEAKAAVSAMPTKEQKRAKLVEYRNDLVKIHQAEAAKKQAAYDAWKTRWDAEQLEKAAQANGESLGQVVFTDHTKTATSVVVDKE